MIDRLGERRPDVLIATGSQLTETGFIVGLQVDQSRLVVKSSNGGEYKVPTAIFDEGYSLNARGNRRFYLLPLNEQAKQLLTEGK